MATSGFSTTDCETIAPDIETLASIDAIYLLDVAWRVIKHVFDGKAPLETNVVCPTCFAILKERGLDKGTRTPAGNSAKEYSEFLGPFMDAVQGLGRKGYEQARQKWLFVCPVWWRKQFEEDSRWAEITDGIREITLVDED